MTPKERAAKIAAYEASFLAEYRSDVKYFMCKLSTALAWLEEAERQHALGEPITTKFARRWKQT